MKPNLARPTVAGVVAFLTFSVAQAGDSWFTKVRPESSAPASGGLLAPAASNDSSRSVFDIVISLESNPQGDDDATDDVAGDEVQRKYEEIVREFADAVCQSTNTAHKLGVVRIFRNFEQKDSADVRWNANCAREQGPRANVSGLGVSGGHIYMCDNWPGAGVFDPMLDNSKTSGFTLAHEWGHYAYGLFDEYVGDETSGADSVPLTTDTASSPSIMHNQWCAAAGALCPPDFTSPDLDFLEFSTDQVAPFSGTGTNAQKRVYGKSGWEVLVQDTDDDPRSSEAFRVTTRIRYTNLESVAPPSGTDYTVNDDESTCRSSLDIRWMRDDLIYELVLDRSGSMGIDGGVPIANAKIGANLLIDQLPEGNAAVGVASFADDVTQDYPIQDIPDPDTGVKTGAKAAVNELTAGGLTSLYDALIFGLDTAESFTSNSTHPNRAKVVFALSDGSDNDSTETQATVTAAYQAADVPIIAFGYGSGAPIADLQALATDTGGSFFQRPTTPAEIQDAFTAANSAVSSAATVTNETTTALAGASTSTPIAVDSTVGVLVFSLTYQGSIGDLDPAVLAPDGSDVGIAFTCESAVGGFVVCRAQLDEADIAANGTGEYTLSLTNAGAVTLDVSTLISATPASGGDTYDIALETTGGATVTYPDEARITATVSRGARIAGLVAFADVTDPNQVTTRIDLLDDGTGGDTIAADGTYSALINYATDGGYNVRVTVNNSAGTGTETTAGELIAHSADGSPLPPPGPTDPVTESFSRSATTQFTVSGVTVDDHADDPNGVDCTPVADDNADTRGRIDFAGDVDCFSVVPSNPAANLVFRATSFSFEMQAVMTIYDSTGAPVTEVDISDSDNPASGVIATITSPDATGMRFAVRHEDAAADTGGYSVSVGPGIFTDISASATCDIDINGIVDRVDIQLVALARGQAAAAGDPLDADGDGIVTILDARRCVLQCTNPRCAP